MGACGEEKNKRDKDKNKTNPDNPDIDNNNQNGIEPLKEETYDKLKATPQIKKSYTIKFLNKDKNQENNKIIEGDSSMNQILSNMKLKENSDYIIEFENKLTIGAEKKNEKFENILNEIFSNNIPEVINMKYTQKGLDIPENAVQAYRENTQIIGNAILDNPETFGIITYENNTRELNSYYYQRSEYPELNTLNSFTAYCNAKNCLYFSGGEKEQPYGKEDNSLPYDEFICIDLTELSTNKNKLVINKLNNLIHPRTWHSMIFVPNKYIFIVGGSNTKTVELYDIDEKKLTKDSELNEIRCECTLCLVNNTYLYAFYGFLLHQDYNNSIERCNLLKEERKWEKVNIIDNCAVKFKPSFFAISYFQNDNLLLIGGNDTGDDERNDFIYKFGKEENEKDEIKEHKFELKENLNIFKDKLFMPLENNKAVNIPLIIGGEIKVIILDTENGDVTSFNYDK